MKPPKQKSPAFSVSPSVLNPVKLELGIILFVTLLLWAGVNITIVEPLTQFAVLFLFSSVAAIWIVLRIKFIVKNLPAQKPTEN